MKRILPVLLSGNLAMAPAIPANVRLANAMELDNNTIITWDPVPEENISSGGHPGLPSVAK